MSLKFGSILSKSSKRREIVDEDEDGSDQESEKNFELQTLLSPELRKELEVLERTGAVKSEIFEQQDEDKHISDVQQAESLQAQQELLRKFLESRVLFQTKIYAPLMEILPPALVRDSSFSESVAPHAKKLVQTIDKALDALQVLKGNAVGSTITTVYSKDHSGSALKRKQIWEKNERIFKRQKLEWDELEEAQRTLEAQFVYPSIETVRNSVEVLSKGFTAFQQPVQRQVSEFLASKNFDTIAETLLDDWNGSGNLKCFMDREYYRFLLRKFLTAEKAKAKSTSSSIFSLDRGRTNSTRTKTDRRSSKGRRLKLEPIPELVNFMHPKPIPLEESILVNLRPPRQLFAT